MIRSMTGFGTAATKVGGATVSLEVRSVNNRHFKCTVRVPEGMESLEAELESRCSRRLGRGSVTISLRLTEAETAVAARIDAERLSQYMIQLDRALSGLGTRTTQDDAATRAAIAGALLALPGVVVSDGGASFLHSVQPAAMALLDEACDRLLAMRTAEGTALRDHVRSCAATLGDRLAAVRDRAPRVVAAYQERLRQRVNALLAEVGAAVEPSDLLREVAIFAERSDIAEEVSRLSAHLAQLDSLLSDANPEPVGRTLDFLAQEMLREANTIASKSADAEISRHVVDMKTAIDRIKEQAQNAE
jgi:uncharacterized protein (TIGR00255 family)